MPVLCDATQARRYPELAVLSALAHMNDHPDGLEVLVNAVAAIEGLDSSHRLLYLGMMSSLANEAAKKALAELRSEGGAYLLSELSEQQQEQVMAKGIEQGIERGIEQGIEQGIERGKPQGQRELLLKQVELKFGPLEAAVIDRINTADEQLVDQLATRILTATTLMELFED